MNVSNLKSFVFLIFVSVAFNLQAQIKVDLNHPEPELTGNIPFDVNFNIEASITGVIVDEIYLVYAPEAGADKHTKYFRSAGNINVRILGQKDGENKFIFRSIKIRPNTNYKFTFTIHERIIIPLQVHTDIKKVILANLENPFDFNQAKFDYTNNEINKVYSGFLVKKGIREVRDEKGDEIDINDRNLLNVFEGKLKPFSDDLLFLGSKIEGLEQTKRNIFNIIKSNVIEDSLITALETIKAKIGDDQNIADFYIRLSKAIKGSLKLDKILNEPKSDTKSPLVQPDFIDKADSIIAIFPDSFNEKEVQAINDFKGRMFLLVSQFVKTDEDLKTNLNNYEAFKKEAEKILDEEIIAVRRYLARDKAFVDMSAQSPYFAYESGAGGRFRPFSQNFNNFIRFGAVNIYPVPVNNDVPLSDFTWPYQLLKSVGVQVGLSKFLFSSPDDRIMEYAGDRSLMIGAGFRLGPLRFNYSGVLYKIADKNPTIDNPKIKCVPYFSLSLQAGIKAIGENIVKMF